MLSTVERLLIPTELDATTAVRAALGREVRALRRFPTGLCHYVYEVQLADGSQLVARLAAASSRQLLEAGVRWSALLRPLGVPLPEELAHDLDERSIPFAFVLLERLPGIDLGLAYAGLSLSDKARIANDVVGAQRLVHKLPTGTRYGYASSPDAAPFASWADVIDQTIADAMPHLDRLGLDQAPPIERVRSLLERLRPYFAEVPATAFLNDTTTKNVLVSHGRLSGIVDVDEVCYGDPLFTLGLTQMSLMHAGHDLDYVTAWSRALVLSEEQQQVVCSYAALFGMIFLGELGQQFNADVAPPVDPTVVSRLLAQIESLIR
jgi:aminoglycoside phosphotransferase (APT) family kinase protein